MNSTRRQAIHSQATLLTLLASSSGLKAFASPGNSEAAVSFGFDAALINHLLVHIELEERTVCGFIATMAGKQYVLTNTQLISGHPRFTLSTLSGTTLRPVKIELSTTRDLARIQIESDKSLNLAAEVADDTAVALASFSSRSDYSELGGVVANATKERFDITASLAKENCGCPILTSDMKACGIVSNIDYYKNTGSGWGNASRHFIYRIEDSAWFTPNWKQYDSVFGKPLRGADDFRQQVYGLACGWMKNLKREIRTDEEVSLEIGRWIKQHNGMVTNLGKKRSSKKGGSDPIKSFRKDFSDSCKALASLCSAKSKNLSFVAEQKNATPFMSNQFKWRSRELSQFVKFVKAFEESNSNYNW